MPVVCDVRNCLHFAPSGAKTYRAVDVYKHFTPPEWSKSLAQKRLLENSIIRAANTTNGSLWIVQVLSMKQRQHNPARRERTLVIPRNLIRGAPNRIERLGVERT